MRLSAIVPLPSEEVSIQPALESLLLQESPFHEVLVAANPGSSSAKAVVGEMAPRFAGRLRCVEAPSVLGTVQLWNFAIGSTSGDWVSLLTPQVTVRPHFVRALNESAEHCPSAGIVRAGWTRERPHGGPPEQHTLLSVRTITHPAEALYEQRFGPKASTAAAAVRKETWERMGGLPERIALLGDWIGDWALWLTAGAHADTVRSPEVIAEIHASVSPVSKNEEMREMHLIYQDILPHAAEAAHLPDPSWIAAASRKRFRDVTIAASNDLRPGPGEIRSQLALALDPWARSVQQEALLERFRSGEKIRSFTFGKKMKPALRRVVAAVR